MSLHAPGLLRDGIRQLRALRRHSIPVWFEHVLIRVEGAQKAERAVLARIGADGRVIPGSERRLDVDAVCIGYGFAPANELAALLGCRPGAMPPGISIAGDAAAPLGAQAALASGEYAAAPAKTAARRLRRATAFQRALWQVFRTPASTVSYATPDTILCRCEGVTFGRVQSLLAAGVSGLGPVKRATRCGMGHCQGRYCGPVLAQLCGTSDAFTTQAPLRAVPIGAIAADIPWAPADPITLPRRPRAATNAGCIAEAEFAVIGAGIIGISTAYELACEGKDVVLLDRGAPNGEASGGNAGSLHVQLLSYAFPDLDGAEARAALSMLLLCRDSARRWEALEAELGADFELRRVGGLSIADTPQSVRRLQQKVALERAAGIEIDMLTGDEARRRIPALSPAVLAASYSADEGKLNPLLAGPAVLAAAVRAGARVLPQTGVLGVEPGHGCYRLHTARGDVRAGRVLNAAGAWAPDIADMLGTPFPVQAAPLQMLVTEPLPHLFDHLVAHCTERLTLKQASNGNMIIGGGWPARVDLTGRTAPTVEGLRGNLGIACRTVPILRSARVIRSWTAMNVGTLGGPVFAAQPGFFHVATVNGLTMGPVLGRICADLLLGRTSEYDLTPFGLAQSGFGLRSSFSNVLR